MSTPAIDDLVGWLRGQFDDDERAAREAARQVADRDCSLVTIEHIARLSPTRALRRVDAMREHVNALLAEAHQTCEDSWYSCSAADDNGKRDGYQECDCGRDERVTRYLRLIAAEYAGWPGYREERESDAG